MQPNRDVVASGRNLFTRTMRHTRRVCFALALAASLSALLLLTGLAGLAPAEIAVPLSLAAPSSATATPHASVSITLNSPTSGQGPVGATLTVSGAAPHGEVAVGAASSNANCANPNAGASTGWITTFGTAQQGPDGTFSFQITWPASLADSNPYALCAVDAPNGAPNSSGGVAAPQTYTVRSSQPPTLSLSSSSVDVGQPFTITGSNFYGEQTINILINGNFNQAAHPDGNGSFIVTVTPTAGQAGNANILAESPGEGGGSKPVLTAAAQITVLGAPTVTPSPSPSPSPTPIVAATSTSTGSGGGLGGNSGGTGGDNTGLIIVLIVAIVLVLLLIGGAITFLVLRRRGSGPEFPGGPAGPGGPGGGWGGYPGPGGTGPVPQYGQGNTGQFGAAAGGYGNSGFYPQQGGYPGSGVQMGGVAQWDDARRTGSMGGMGGVSGWDDPGESAPGPDWQPRPMSGSRRRYEDPSYPGYPAPEPAPVDPYGAPAPGAYPPPDPWAGNQGGFSGPTQGYPPPSRGTGYPPPTRGTGYPPPNPTQRQPPEDNWSGDDWNQGGGRGAGGTNPANHGW